MNLISKKIEETKKFQDYIKTIKEKNSQVHVSGLSDVAKIRSFLLYHGSHR